MLATLLPGVRDLRTPLAVGYTLIVVGWLVFEDNLPNERHASGVLADVYELINLFGGAAALAALSFIAYLLGSTLIVARTPAIILNMEWVGRGRPRSGVLSNLDSSPRVSAAQLRGRSDEPGLQALLPPSLVNDLSDFASRDREAEIAAFLDKQMIIEGYNAVARLQVKSPPLYDAYDRLMAEAQLRLSMFVPLLALLAVLVFETHPATLLLAALPLVLLYQGARKEIEARTLLNEAFSDGLVESSLSERLNAWLQTPPTDANR